MSSARTAVERLVDARGIDWSRPQSVAAGAGAVLDGLTGRPDLLADLVRDLTRPDAAGAASESHPHMDKLVLWQSRDAAVRLRLHVFFPGYLDRPHNHRWSFVSRILSGSYVHTIYGTDTDVLGEIRAGREPRPRYVRREEAGSAYLLENTMVHSLHTDEVTVSLLLRGPSVKDQYFTVLPGDGRTPPPDRLVWSGGAPRESTAELREKRITAGGVERVRAVLDTVLGRLDRGEVR